ncbi:MAG: hypothetical protein ACE5Z5_13750 [Candidatus Bathyarchaeia archaeon]
MRPHLCPDESCEVLRTDYSREVFDKGASYTCFGKMRDPHIFVAKKTEHLNEYSFCYYTPLKGHVRFFINADDAWSDFLGFAAIMDHANPLSCDECGPINRSSNVLWHFRDGSKLCSMCAVRLGKVRWHEKERRYY